MKENKREVPPLWKIDIGRRKVKLPRYIKYLGIVFIFILALGIPIRSWAKDRGKIILIAMDRVSLEEIKDANTPNIDRLINMGGMGLMTTNTGGALNQDNSYLTLGAGARVTGIKGSQGSYYYGEKYRGVRIEDLIYQITGYRMKEGAIAQPSIARFGRANSKRPYGVEIGALGRVLRDAGKSVLILGNSDNYRQERREAGTKSYLTLMLMDNRGIVGKGIIDNTLLMEDSTMPMGIMMDYERLYSSYLESKENIDVVGIELGDTPRAENFKNQAMDYRTPLHKKKAIEASDNFIGKILENFNIDKDLFILISPVGPSEEIARNNRLAPIFMAGKGISKGSWLTSGSTHRKGVVTNLDIGVSILDFFKLSPLPEQGGAPIYSLSQNGGLLEVIYLNEELVRIYNQRPIFIRGYVYGIIALLVISLLILLYRRKYLRFVTPIQIFVMVIPLVYILLPLLQRPSIYINIIIAFFMALVFTYGICYFLNSNENRLMVLSMTTLAVLIGDQWLGMGLIQSSPLGYDVIAGARFYGLGNEYMGIAIGSMAILMSITSKKLKRFQRPFLNYIPFVWGLITLYTMASPRLGANVGGTIGTFAVFISMAFLLRDKRVRVRDIAIVSSALIITLGFIFFIDSLETVDSQSHMGRTALAIRERGARELLEIINRKITMNLRLFRSTVWTKVFISSLGAMILLLFRPLGIFRDVYLKNKILIKGLIGVTIGSIAAILFNDSGIVAGATAMVFGAPPLILLVATEIQGRTGCDE